MKIKPNYVLRNVANSWIVLPLAEENLNLNGMLTLNGTGVFLWKALEQGSEKFELVNMLTEKYDVSSERAEAGVDAFLEKLQVLGCIEAD